MAIHTFSHTSRGVEITENNLSINLSQMEKKRRKDVDRQRQKASLDARVLTELTVIWLRVLFSEEKRNGDCLTLYTPLHKHSCPSSKQYKHVGAGKINFENSRCQATCWFAICIDVIRNVSILPLLGVKSSFKKTKKYTFKKNQLKWNNWIWGEKMEKNKMDFILS